MKNKFLKKAVCLLMLSVTVPMGGCGNKSGADITTVPDVPAVSVYEGPFSEVNGALGGVDDLGRVIPADVSQTGRENKKVGIFYFLWQGEHGTGGPYDNSKIYQKNPDAVLSEANWLKYGGGGVGEHHFWGEPLFGYYTSKDKWVMRRHLQMFVDASIDFIVFDTTNAYTYTERVKDLISVWYEYLLKGVRVPQLAFYTNSSSGSTINKLYREIYASKELRKQYPRLDELFFRWDGKPLIIGKTSDKELSDECRAYFRIKESVWPNGPRCDDGFPWMEFSRNMTDDAVYGNDGRKEVVNVSVAQHDATCTMSATAWYGANDRTRSWHDGANDRSVNASAYCYNFIEQWEWALSVDPEIIFITGWNEWVAQRQPATLNPKYPIYFVDCCDPDTSRDVEPMAGLFGDNYYMTMVSYIRKFKGCDSRVRVGDDVTIDTGAGFEQWDNPAITARYADFDGETGFRSTKGFGQKMYSDNSGRNDFVSMKVTKDRENLYFYAQTAENISPQDGRCWMTLFISSGREDTPLWANVFDYAVNLSSPEGNSAIISGYDGEKWTECGRGTLKTEGNRIMISVPRDVLGIGAFDPLNVQFKWADNYSRDSSGNIDVFSFYTRGDAAPYGRLTYIFSEKK